MSQTRILIIEDDPDGRASVTEAMQDLEYETTAEETGAAGVQRFRESRYDIVLTDLMLPDVSGLDVLQRVRGIDPQVPVLIMTAYGSVATAVDALKSGAYDYITKPMDLDDLQSKVRRAVETRRLRTEVAALHNTLRERYSARAIVAVSDAMQAVVRDIELLANTDATVLVTGESGTGKEMVARSLHVDGTRASGPFVPVNCGAFSESLLDSELFGHERGAFTGATQQRKGAFERADGGTLFLDEVGDAPPSVQVKLLRVIEERELYRVGGQAPVKVNVRLVSASNRDLADQVAAGEFRQDLLYRLKVATIDVPPLRRHRADIRPLAERFLAAACEEHGRHVARVEPAYFEKLERYDWPGNVRELRNAVEVSVVLVRGATLTAEDARIGAAKNAAAEAWTVPEEMTFEELEKEILGQTLGRYKGNRTLAAEKLGLSRRTIQRKIKEYELPF